MTKRRPIITPLTRAAIQQLALANGFSMKVQKDGKTDLNPYVYDFAKAMIEHAVSDLLTQHSADPLQHLADYLNALNNAEPIQTFADMRPNEKIADYATRMREERDQAQKALVNALQFLKTPQQSNANQNFGPGETKIDFSFKPVSRNTLQSLSPESAGNVPEKDNDMDLLLSVKEQEPVSKAVTASEENESPADAQALIHEILAEPFDNIDEERATATSVSKPASCSQSADKRNDRFGRFFRTRVADVDMHEVNKTKVTLTQAERNQAIAQVMLKKTIDELTDHAAKEDAIPGSPLYHFMAAIADRDTAEFFKDDSVSKAHALKMILSTARQEGNIPQSRTEKGTSWALLLDFVATTDLVAPLISKYLVNTFIAGAMRALPSAQANAMIRWFHAYFIDLQQRLIHQQFFSEDEIIKQGLMIRVFRMLNP